MESATLIEDQSEVKMTGSNQDYTKQSSEGVQHATPGVAAIQATSKEREKQVLKALSLQYWEEEENDQKEQLCSLVCEFADLFTLSNREFSRTSVVTHEI